MSRYISKAPISRARPLEGTYIVTPHVLEYMHTNGSTWMQKYYTGVIYYGPKRGTCLREIPQNRRTLAAGLIAPKWVSFDDPC